MKNNIKKTKKTKKKVKKSHYRWDCATDKINTSVGQELMEIEAVRIFKLSYRWDWWLSDEEGVFDVGLPQTRGNTVRTDAQCLLRLAQPSSPAILLCYDISSRLRYNQIPKALPRTPWNFSSYRMQHLQLVQNSECIHPNFHPGQGPVLIYSSVENQPHDLAWEYYFFVSNVTPKHLKCETIMCSSIRVEIIMSASRLMFLYSSGKNPVSLKAHLPLFEWRQSCQPQGSCSSNSSGNCKRSCSPRHSLESRNSGWNLLATVSGPLVRGKSDRSVRYINCPWTSNCTWAIGDWLIAPEIWAWLNHWIQKRLLEHMHCSWIEVTKLTVWLT